MTCPKCGSKNRYQIPEEEFYTKEEKEQIDNCQHNQGMFYDCNCPEFYSILKCRDCGHRELDD